MSTRRTTSPKLGNSEPAHTWGRNIHDQRKRLGLTQQQLADAVGVTRQAVTSWENGLTLPTPQYVNPIADALHSSADLLFPWSAARQAAA